MPIETDPTTVDSLVRGVARVDDVLAPGQLLDGTYELAARIGGGGMGEVYRARDVKLGREVAVKVLTLVAGPKGEHLRRLFDREAKITAQLHHPNIVTLHHIGEHRGHPYLVLELLAGETLAERLAKRGPMPIAEALGVLDAVLAGLAFAHQHGVLHRDLKPSNVFVTADGRIKVLDFGVAFSLGSNPGTVTRSAGTPAYMPPEQRDGRAQDPRTDLWAAALLFVECAHGRRPPEHEVIGVLRGLDLAPAAREAIERALATDPAHRPPSADALRRGLAPSPPQPSPSRARWPYLAGAIALVAAVTVAVVATRSSSTTTNIGIDNRTTTVITNPPAGSAPAAPTMTEADTCKLYASSRVWATVETCAKQLAAKDPKLADALLAQAKREAVNEAIYKEFSTALHKQGLDAARAIAAKLPPDSVYQQDVKVWLDTVANGRDEAIASADEGDCKHLVDMVKYLAIYEFEVTHVECRAEPNDPACHGQDVLEDAKFEFTRVSYKAALAKLEELLACRARNHQAPVSGTYFRAVKAACSAGDAGAAKKYLASVDAKSQRSAIRFCQNKNIALP